MALVGNISGSIQNNSKIGISGSIIIANKPDATFPALPGTDVKFYVDQLGLFGSEGVVSSGSLAVKDSSGVSKFSVASSTGNTTVAGTLGVTSAATLSSTLAVAGNVNVNTDKFTITAATGAVSGSSTAAFGPTLANGSLTVTATGGTGNATIAGDIAVNGGDITTTSTSATIFNSTATTLAIGSGATVGLSIGAAAGLVTVAGDLKVSGNDIQSSTATALTLSGADVEVKGDLQITGNDIKSSTGATAITLSAGNVIIPGDLTVNGTTITADVTTVTVEDPIMALGFTSGSIAVSAGDRGWVGGILSSDNVAMIWDNSAAEFVVGRTAESGTDADVSLASYSPFHAGNIQGSIISASLGFSGSLTKLMDGTSYIIAGSNITVTSASNGAITIDGPSPGAPTGAQYLVLSANAGLDSERVFTAGTGLLATDAGANGNYTLAINDSVVATISGSTFLGAVKFNQGLSGSLTKLVDGTSYLIAGANISITSASNGAVTISTAGGIGDVVGPGSSTGDAVALFDGTTGKLLKNSSITTADGGTSLFVAGKLGVSGSLTSAGVASLNSGLYVAGSAGLSGSLTVAGVSTLGGIVDVNNSLWVDQSMGVSGSLNVAGTTTFGADVLPSVDNTYNLGSATFRWANVYTGDLHLRNDRGDYTLIEEEDYLTIRFNKTGKRYKFLLEAVPHLDEEPPLKF